jgi:hypothetical protein
MIEDAGLGCQRGVGRHPHRRVGLPGWRRVRHHLVGLPVQEVAEQLGVPVGTVKARLSRGRAALARRLTTQVPEVLHDDR